MGWQIALSYVHIITVVYIRLCHRHHRRLLNLLQYCLMSHIYFLNLSEKATAMSKSRITHEWNDLAGDPWLHTWRKSEKNYENHRKFSLVPFSSIDIWFENNNATIDNALNCEHHVLLYPSSLIRIKNKNIYRKSRKKQIAFESFISIPATLLL